MMDFEIVKTEPSKEPNSRSNYEVFAAAEGILRVTERYEIESPLLKSGTVKFTLVRSRNTQADSVSIALHIQFKDQKGIEVSSFLDEDEIKSVETALRYIATHRETIWQAAMTYTEIDYSSRGGFRLGLFTSGWDAHNWQGKYGEFMVVGRRNVFLHSLGDLSKTIDAVLFKIEVLKGQVAAE
jgi:hypothetical protein